jgi:hypothetical protein
MPKPDIDSDPGEVMAVIQHYCRLLLQIRAGEDDEVDSTIAIYTNRIAELGTWIEEVELENKRNVKT